MDLFKTHDNGQWEMLSKHVKFDEDGEEDQNTHVTFHDGSKKSFGSLTDAHAHLLAHDHLPVDDTGRTFHQVNDHTKRAKITTMMDRRNPRTSRRADSGTGPTRRK